MAQIKPEEDFSGIVDDTLPKYEEIGRGGRLEQATELILALEKKTRQASDVVSTSRLANSIVTLYFEAKNWTGLNEQLVILSKRRGQLKTVVQNMVQLGISFIEKVEADIKLNLINTLRDITAGKIFVEIERARLTKILSKIKEEEGKLNEASNILQEIQVETFGQMDKNEKTQFILEQMRLCLEQKDYIRVQILSRKIGKKVLEEEGFNELKVRYYEMMVQYFSHEDDYLEVSRSYQSIFNTKSIQDDKESWQKYLKLMCVYVVLSAHGNEQNDLLNRIFTTEKKLEDLLSYKNLLKFFLTHELMRWPLVQEMYKDELNQHEAFSEMDSPLWDLLRKRVVQHNVRVLAKYYNRITSKRLTELLDLSEEESEEYISTLVVSKDIYARINRPAGIVSFQKTKDPNEHLNEWVVNISKLLNLVEETNQSINKILTTV